MNDVVVMPAAGAIGAYVEGLALARIDSAAQDWLASALAQYGVLFFRQQSLTPTQLANLGRRFGTLQIHPVYPQPEGASEVAVR